jgi:glycosyltransferase involved in cell wall biosynthesis
MPSHVFPRLSSPVNCDRDAIKVCHIACGKIWAGAEAQIATLLCVLKKEPALEVSAILFSEGKLSQVLRNGGVCVTVLDQANLNSWQIFLGLLEVFNQKKVDIVHTHGYKANVLGGVAARLRKVARVCRTLHGMPERFRGINRLKMSFYLKLDRFVERYLTDSIIAVSLDIKQRLSKSYQNDLASRVVCVHNTINVHSITARIPSEKKKLDLEIPPGNRVIMTAGRLVPIKGLDYFLKAAQLIVQTRTDVTFLVVGDGPLRASLERLSYDLNLDDHVRFLGWRPDIYDLLSMADVLVIASLHEGIPTILLEALAMGTSVVATRTGGIPEVIVEPALGTLITPKSAEAIAANCLKFLDSNSDVEVERRKQYVECQFSADIASKRVLELYRQLHQNRAISGLSASL